MNPMVFDQPLEFTRKRKTGRTNLEGTPEVFEVQVTLERRLKAIDAKHRPALRALIESGPRITTISPQDLRHTCGSLWLRRKSPTELGRPIEVVSRDLGHQDINVKYKIYRHVLESERERHVRDLFADTSWTRQQNQTIMSRRTKQKPP